MCTEVAPQVFRRAWKALDLDKVESWVRKAPPTAVPTSTLEIDNAINALQKYSMEFIENTVPWAKPWENSKEY